MNAVICVKSSPVKSSQVQISMAAAPAAFGAPAGARDREGAARRNWHGWKALSRGFYPHLHIVFFLIIAARRPRSPTSCLFQEVFCMAMQTRSRPTCDDGSDRGPAQGLSRWAKASVGSGDRAGAASRASAGARGPSPTSFWRLGPDKGASIILEARQERLARRRQSDRGRVL